MNRTIVKTGVVLMVQANGHIQRDIGLMGVRLYGDLHVVGKCAVVYYPLQTLDGKTESPRCTMPADGVLNLEETDYFQRHGSPFSILIAPASCIKITRGSWDPLDFNRWVAAGGMWA